MSAPFDAPASEDESISRRRFLGGATAGAIALSGLSLAASAEQAAPGSNNEPLPPQWFEAPDPSIPKAGLRWAFSAHGSAPACWNRCFFKFARMTHCCWRSLW